VSGTIENGAHTWVSLIADSAGRFIVDGVAPGSWHAFALDTIGPLNADTIRHLVFDGGLARTAHHLREGETVHVKLRLSPAFE
jgi:hypothetical protein